MSMRSAIKSIIQSVLLGLLLLLPAAYNYAVGAVDKAAGEQSTGQPETMNISIGVLKGPSGIGIIKLVAELKTLPQNVSLDYMIMAEPLEMITRLTSGELQAGLLPLNVAAKLYTKGAGYPLAAIPGLGALYILSRDSSLNDWQDLAGKTVYAHGKGATPDYLFHYFLNVKGIDSESVFLNFSIPAPQLAPMAAAGKVDTVLLPQPFVSLIMMHSPDMTIRLDLQKTWMEVQEHPCPIPLPLLLYHPNLRLNGPRPGRLLWMPTASPFHGYWPTRTRLPLLLTSMAYWPPDLQKWPSLTAVWSLSLPIRQGRKWKPACRFYWMPIRFPWEELCPMTVFILPHRSLSDLRLTARFLPFSSEASLLLASSEPPSFAFAAIRGGFSSLSLSALYGMRVHRLAYPAAALPKYSRSPSYAPFLSPCIRKNHQKSPRSLKVRQTPSMPLTWNGEFRNCVGKYLCLVGDS